MILGNPILLGGGGGIDITVVGGTTRPENPKENTIWINSTKAVGNVYVSANRPLTASDNDVWIQFNAGNNMTINIADKPYVFVNVANVYQYSGTAWTIVPGAELYTNGAWLTLSATASPVAMSGVTYTKGISGLTPAQVDMFSKAISNNDAITNTTNIVYADYREIHRKINIGDQIAIELNGTNYNFDVIGFNHDALTNSTAYEDATATGKAGITFQMHDVFPTEYEMNSSRTNSGGWKSSDMRTSTMATMKGYLPSAWQSIIKPVNKASGTGGGSSSGTETVSDSCFLLAEIEIFGKASHSVSGEGSQYAYYKPITYKYKNTSGTSNAVGWWERSPVPDHDTGFCLVSNLGTVGTKSQSDRPDGVAFGFCV